jgi:hypothetical protein
MWKIAVAFVAFAALALFMLSKGGDIDMSGEKHGDDAMHAPAPAQVAASAPSVPVVAASAATAASATASSAKP